MLFYDSHGELRYTLGGVLPEGASPVLPESELTQPAPSPQQQPSTPSEAEQPGAEGMFFSLATGKMVTK